MQEVNELWHTSTPAQRDPATCSDDEKCLGSSGKADLSEGSHTWMSAGVAPQAVLSISAVQRGESSLGTPCLMFLVP